MWAKHRALHVQTDLVSVFRGEVEAFVCVCVFEGVGTLCYKSPFDFVHVCEEWSQPKTGWHPCKGIFRLVLEIATTLPTRQEATYTAP